MASKYTRLSRRERQCARGSVLRGWRPHISRNGRSATGDWKLGAAVSSVQASSSLKGDADVIKSRVVCHQSQGHKLRGLLKSQRSYCFTARGANSSSYLFYHRRLWLDWYPSELTSSRLAVGKTKKNKTERIETRKDHGGARALEDSRTHTFQVTTCYSRQRSGYRRHNVPTN